ncbi:hypothetical protein Poli38472_009086 [Pythium oligandrum]|uniref:Transmembrane protein n=1 Tax=Pythium oligandrum TaxID=41045 RepID=A0A8K1FL61_PYTOL|nr:hypothetical protein Poli38472_009086 [Pythium oligandrum]|eukprot:TMW64919.1 hypothetical protein Poli38472_009086 [Pythium oligandrum]
MAQVVPREAVEASPDAVDYCLYELKPSHALPTLDLSVSIMSRLLSRSSLNVVNRFVRSRQLVFALFLASVAFTIMVMLVPADVGVPLAVVSFILGVPSCLVGFVLLRSSVIAVLLKVGDVWLMSMLSAASFIILALMFRDARGLAFCTQLIGVQTNILIDANLRGVRRLAITTVIACVGLVYVCFMVSLHAVPDLHDLYVFQYGSHHMLGSTCFLNGILTLVAIMLRNVYRKRHALRRGMNMDVIECHPGSDFTGLFSSTRSRLATNVGLEFTLDAVLS